MCGIFCSISRVDFRPLTSNAKQLLQRRGPDSIQERKVAFKTQADETVFLSFSASVLSLRGSSITVQPLTHTASGCVLCWNGEAWKLFEKTIDGNDGSIIFDLLVQASSEPESNSRILAILEAIRGPYAFIFFDGRSKKLYFGRDCLGRRSLLKTRTIHGDTVILSVSDLSIKSPDEPWHEIESDGVHVYDLFSPGTTEDLSEIVAAYSTRSIDTCTESENCIVLPYGNLNKTTPLTTPPTRLFFDSPAVSKFEALLKRSLELRISKVREIDRVSNLVLDNAVRVAILFSGGLDCTVLARLSHELLPPTNSIDLLNVAFENPRVHKGELSPYELCPDRITARSSFKELKNVCTGRNFRLTCINVSYAEFQEHRQTIIDLIQPHNTEMDLSIACALYFASRGIGEMAKDASKEETTHYCSSARIVLSGLGADELFGGYQRHATAFSRKGFTGLLDELELDISRLGKRNLGRDDRVISFWAKEARYPFLDEDVVAWALQAPIWEKVGFGTQACDEALLTKEKKEIHGIEDGKLLLRVLAWKLGMKDVARVKKRAIQFGARTAKMEAGKSKGTHLIS